VATKKCDVLILMEVFLSLIRCSLISVEPGRWPSESTVEPGRWPSESTRSKPRASIVKQIHMSHKQRWPKHPTVLCARLGPQMVLQTASRSVAEDGAGVGTRVGSQTVRMDGTIVGAAVGGEW